MPNPEVVKMRRRLMKLIRLAEEAAEKGYRERAEKIIEDLGDGKISYMEALKALERLTSDPEDKAP